VLLRVIGSPRSRQAVLENPANKAEDKRIEVGEAFYGGILVLVHPKGVVSEKNGQLMYHSFGQALKDCSPLSAENQPLLQEEVMKLEKRAAGIRGGGIGEQESSGSDSGKPTLTATKPALGDAKPVAGDAK
jgi:hypothetical protein